MPNVELSLLEIQLILKGLDYSVDSHLHSKELFSDDKSFLRQIKSDLKKIYNLENKLNEYLPKAPTRSD
tara:strand:- start:42 stop:248 length:207 start_codon:yes stop_codon:yes gene_type:complete